MKIGFYTMQFDRTMGAKSIYDWADYSEKLLNNESIIIGTNQRTRESLNRFENRFKTILINEDWSPHDNMPIRKRFEKIVDDEKLDAFFISYDGRNYSMLPTNTKTLVSCVFTMGHKHGDKYCGISEYLAKKHNMGDNWVPYLINLPDPTENLRKKWNISEDAIIFARHGGRDSFHNIANCYDVIRDIVNKYNDKYFVFMNTDEFYKHPQILYLEGTSNPQEISNFICSSDAMMHSRRGETFGMSIGEFSWFNKPVITAGICNDDTAHLEILGDQAIKYTDYQSLYDILCRWDKTSMEWGFYSAYRRFSAQNVMKKFEKEFLNG